LLGSWTGILLHVDPVVAAHRLGQRSSREHGHREARMADLDSVSDRPEDRPETIERRLADSTILLTSLLDALASSGRSAIRIDADTPPARVLRSVLEALESAHLGQ
jgi:adenylate kinase family enzyme